MKAPIRILLIDDSEEYLRHASRFLENEDDFSVVGAATTGSSGVALAREVEPDVVLLDLSLRDESGFTVIPHLKDAVDGVRVIVVSSADGETHGPEAVRNGADGYVEKTYLVRELPGAIRETFRDLDA